MWDRPAEKAWIFRYQLNGKPRQIGLGPVPDVSSQPAREKGDVLQSQKADGINPLAARDEQRRSECRGGQDEAAECGIIVAGRGMDDHCYIIRDLSGRMSPDQWGRRAVDALGNYSADRIVCKRNFGGAMCESAIRSVTPDASVKMPHASRGKTIHAEPVVSLCEQSRVHHVGIHCELEDQMTT